MASDLSKIIPENLSDTLSDLLAKDTSVKECTKLDKRDIEHSELIRIDVEFAFDKLTSILSYYVPAQSASLIFNIMMGAPDNEILSRIDDDTADAMAEFISNTCGGLVTTINASEFEDIGKAKFNIKHKEIFYGNTIESTENIYRFLINLEGNDIAIFTKFEENFTGFITELTNTQQTFYPEEIKEETVEEVIEEEPIKEEVINEKELTEEDQNIDPKSKKLKIIIMIVAGLVVFTLLAGIIMYMIGMFDPKPIEKPKDTNTTEKSKNSVEIEQYKPLNKVDFKMSDINVVRLNNKLELLNKYQVLTQEELEAQAQEEKQRIIQLKKEQELIEFAKQNKEEPLVIEEKKDSKEIPISSNKIEEAIKTPEVQNPVEVKKEQIPENKIINMIEPDRKLKFVLVNSLKYKLFKELVLKTNSTQARISICNSDMGKTQIFIGPFENEELQVKMNTLIRESDTTTETLIANITQEEFDTKCNF